MAPRRLPEPPGPRRPQVTFTFDRREIEAPEGEPVAVALLAAGQRILSRSFRFHRPRGLMCASGRCGWCECEVDGRPSVKTCQVPVRAGSVVRGEHALGTVDRDLLGFLGLVARRIPPTFYHHRFLRPRAFRQRYLDVIRWFGGRGRLRTDADPLTSPPGRPVERVEVDVLVVGGGPGGRLAAAGAADAGARVLLLDAGTPPGGPDGVEVLPRTTAVGLYDGVLLALAPETQLEIRARAIVAATGSLEHLPTIRGIDLPGVMSARLVERLVRDHGVLPGERVVVVGDRADRDPIRALLQQHAALVALIATHELEEVAGRRHVTGVRLTDGRQLAADVVAICDRAPALELALAAGIPTAWRAGRLVPQNVAGATADPAFWLAGSAVGEGATREDPERHREVGRQAARAALARVLELDAAVRSGERAETPGAPPPVQAPDRAIVCFCEDVHVDELRHEAAVADGEIELLKRRTGALTGPCQGAYCLAGVVACAAAAHPDGSPRLATSRPPLRGIRLGDLVADEPGSSSADGTAR